MVYVWIGVGGFCGALSRYWLGAYIARRWPSAFPRGTFVINISGAVLLGLVVGLSEAGLVSPALKTPVATGFLGAYTTFSTWMLETLRLTDSRSYLLAGANLFFTLAAGLAGAAAGLYLGH